MKVLNFTSPKWVYLIKSIEKWLCKTRKYIIVVAITLFILKFLKISVSKVSNDLDANRLNYGTFVIGGHLEFLHHFEMLFNKIHFLVFWLDYQNMSTL
jgi:hypothetical protein